MTSKLAISNKNFEYIGFISKSYDQWQLHHSDCDGEKDIRWDSGGLEGRFRPVPARHKERRGQVF